MSDVSSWLLNHPAVTVFRIGATAGAILWVLIVALLMWRDWWPERLRWSLPLAAIGSVPFLVAGQFVAFRIAWIGTGCLWCGPIW